MRQNNDDVSHTPSTSTMILSPSPQKVDLSQKLSPLHTLVKACEIITQTKENGQDDVSSPIDKATRKEFQSSLLNRSKNNLNISDETCVSWAPTNNMDRPIPPILSSSPHRNDVLCGRGGVTLHHPGNIYFRLLVSNRREIYHQMTTHQDKALVVDDVLTIIRGIKGRFLERSSSNSNANDSSVWVEVCHSKSRRKTSQALRERLCKTELR